MYKINSFVASLCFSALWFCSNQACCDILLVQLECSGLISCLQLCMNYSIFAELHGLKGKFFFAGYIVLLLISWDSFIFTAWMIINERTSRKIFNMYPLIHICYSVLYSHSDLKRSGSEITGSYCITRWRIVVLRMLSENKLF